MTRVASVLIAALTLGCATSASRAAQAQTARATAPQPPRTETLTAEDVVRIERVIDVSIDPDGRRIAYVVAVPRTADDKPGHSHREIHVMDTGTKASRRYTRPDHRSWSPQWSPDGEWLGFLSRRDGSKRTQVYRMSVRGGEPEPVTSSKGSIRSFAWSPDGTRLAYLADRQPSKAEDEDSEAGRDWKLGDVHGTHRRLWVMDLKSGKSTPVTDPAVHIEAFEWSPDGKRFAVQAADRSDVDAVMMYSDLYVVDAAGGELKRLLEHDGKLGDFEWSPDGRQVAFLGADNLHDPTPGVLYVADVANQSGRKLTAELEATGSWIDWTQPDAIVMLADVGTRTAFFEVSPASGKIEQLSEGGPICHGADADPRGRLLACAGDRPDHPRELYAGSRRTAKLQRWTTSNDWLATKKLGEREVVRWKAADGLEIEGVLTKPVGYQKGKRYPLAVLVHGGPEGVSYDGWNTRAGYPVQLFATAGYVVLEPNYRGSRGRGVAYGQADHKDLGGKEFEDVVAGVDHLVAQGLVDKDRVGIGGWSYGGYFSGLGATKWSARFKAAMVGAAITNWISFTGTTEIEHENSLVHWNLWPWDNYELAWDRSPVAHAKDSKTATLIVHGADDTRVPPEQATELYRALRYFKVPTELVMYPREGHGLGERAHEVDFMKRWLEWFDRHVAAR